MSASAMQGMNNIKLDYH